MVNPLFDRVGKHQKYFIDSAGDIENVQPCVKYHNGQQKYIIGKWCWYSHPVHLEQYYGYKIRNFTDMDKALDEREWIRVNDSPFDGIEYNIGNVATDQQLQLIEKIFEERRRFKGFKIKSASRKFYKTFNEFMKAYDNRHNIQIELSDNDFKTHTQALMM